MINNRNLMIKAASAIRTLEYSNEKLKEENSSLKETVSSLSEYEKKAESANLVLKLVVDGEVDPDDALEKFAEIELMSEDEIKLILGNNVMDKVAHVSSNSDGKSSDPLTSFLLGV